MKIKHARREAFHNPCGFVTLSTVNQYISTCHQLEAVITSIVIIHALKILSPIIICHRVNEVNETIERRFLPTAYLRSQSAKGPNKYVLN